MRIDPDGLRRGIGGLAVAFAVLCACFLLAVRFELLASFSIAITLAQALMALALSFLLRGAAGAAAWFALLSLLVGATGVLGHLLAFNGVFVDVARAGFALTRHTGLQLGAALASALSAAGVLLAATRLRHGFGAEALGAAGVTTLLLLPLVLYVQVAQPNLLGPVLAQALLDGDAMLLLAGASLLVLASAVEARQSFDLRNRFLPALAFGVLLAASFQFWQVIVGEEQLAIRRQTEATTARIRTSLNAHLNERKQALDRMAERLESMGDLRRRDLWARDAAAYLDDFQSISAIGWIEPDMRVRWAVSRDNPHHLEGEIYAVDDARLRTLALAREQHGAAASNPIALRGGGYGQILALPMYETGHFLGWLVVGLRFEQLFASEVGAVAPDFGVRIAQNGIVLYERNDDGAVHPYSHRVHKELRADNLAWWIEVWPAAAFFNNLFLWLPGCLLTLGLLAALLFAFALFQLETQRRRTLSLRASEERYRIVAEQTGALVYDYDVASGEIEWAGAIQEVTGETPETFGSVNVHGWKKRVHPDDAPRVLAELERARDAVTRFQCEYRFGRADGGYLRVMDAGLFIAGSDGRAVRMLGNISDVSERYEHEQQLRFMAHYDPQTGLHNRAWFMAETLQRAQMHGAASQWLLFMDVDRFRAVNETLGHAVGDQLLQAVAQRLRQVVDGGGELARVGGDEFALCVYAPGTDRSSMNSLCEKIVAAFVPPFDAAGHSLFVTLSIGAAHFPGDGHDVQQAIRAAETAMFRAKQRGRNTWVFYETNMSVGARENLEIANALRTALERNEFHLVFQPRVALGDGRITGMEALLRWTSASLGTVSPAQFIPVAEETGLIGPIGWYVVDAAAAAARELGPERMRGRRIAINVSARQLLYADFVAELLRRIDAAGGQPQWFELELTESLVMEDPARARKLFLELHRAGFAISIDDFGTGYSSLSYLKHFPVDHLKIDRSFVTDLPQNADDAAIVRTIVNMGHGLGLRLIAEGIETEAQRHFLELLGCEEGQGFLFARPMPLVDLKQRLA